MILERLNKIFVDVFDDEDIVLTRETTSNDIEDWDSLAQINLIMCIKDEFKVDFELEEVAKYKNVGDMVDAIEQKIK